MMKDKEKIMTTKTKVNSTIKEFNPNMSKIAYFKAINEGNEALIKKIINNPSTPLDVLILTYFKLLNDKSALIVKTPSKESLKLIQRIKTKPLIKIFNIHTNQFLFLNYKLFMVFIEEMALNPIYQIALSKNNYCFELLYPVLLKDNNPNIIKAILENKKISQFKKHCLIVSLNLNYELKDLEQEIFN